MGPRFKTTSSSPPISSPTSHGIAAHLLCTHQLSATCMIYDHSILHPETWFKKSMLVLPRMAIAFPHHLVALPPVLGFAPAFLKVILVPRLSGPAICSGIAQPSSNFWQEPPGSLFLPNVQTGSQLLLTYYTFKVFKMNKN